MTEPGEIEDINEAVGGEWEAETTSFERVHDVISRTYVPVSAEDIAGTARTSPESARNHLEELADEGFVQTETDSDGGTTYRRSPRSIVVEQALEILDNITTDELAARVSDMSGRVEQEVSEDMREWQATRRNLAVANAALAIDEATQAVDDRKVSELSEIEQRRRAAREELRRMFRDKDYDAHTDIDSPATDFDEDELAAEIDELEAELEDELGVDGE